MSRMFADGAPMGSPYGRQPLPGPGGPSPGEGVEGVTDLPVTAPDGPRSTLGPRADLARAAVALRWLSSYLLVLLCAGVTHACFVGTSAASAGAFLLCSSMLIAISAAAGCAMWAGDRQEVVRQARHYIFGLVAVPGAGLAVFSWASRGFTSQATQFDSFTSLLGAGLPIVFFVTVCLPPLVFLKYVAGLRTITRSNMDSQELVEVYSRQDGLMR